MVLGFPLASRLSRTCRTQVPFWNASTLLNVRSISCTVGHWLAEPDSAPPEYTHVAPVGATLGRGRRVAGGSACARWERRPVVLKRDRLRVERALGQVERRLAL